jgi:hypothetical protein
MIATSASTTLVTSSAVLATGAPKPAVVALMTGRAAAFIPCTPNETAIPIAIGTHWLLLKNSAGSVTVTVSELDAAPNARPPEVGRMNVWITSLTWSTIGTLSATNSTASRAPSRPMTHSFSSHAHCCGRLIRSVYRLRTPIASNGM